MITPPRTSNTDGHFASDSGRSDPWSPSPIRVSLASGGGESVSTGMQPTVNVTIDKEEPEQTPVIDLAGAPKPYYTPPPIPCHAPDPFTMIADKFDSFSEDGEHDFVYDVPRAHLEEEVRALEVLICTIEDKMDTIEKRVIKLEKSNIDTVNHIMLVINIAIFAYLVACYF